MRSESDTTEGDRLGKEAPAGKVVELQALEIDRRDRSQRYIRIQRRKEREPWAGVVVLVDN
jgi:hypothetical protein